MNGGPERPNVLLFLSHDIGLTYGCYGHRVARTPAVDGIAATGVVFNSHYCHYPLCGPSRANLFSGLGPDRTGRHDNTPFFGPFRSRGPAGWRSLPEHFHRHGYDTHACGLVYHDEIDEPSWSQGHRCFPDSNDSGDEAYQVPLPLLAGWRDPGSRELVRQRCETFLRAGVPPAMLAELPYRRKVRGPAVEAASVADDAYHDGKVARAAVEWLEKRKHAAPFMLVCGFVAAHTPFRAPRRYWDLYDRTALELPDCREVPLGSPEWVARDCEPAQYYTQHDYEQPWRANAAQSLELLHGHLATVSYIDAQIALVMEALRRNGRDHDTIVVVLSDHGFSDGQHGYWGKHNLWDASLHTPLIIRPHRGDRRVAGPTTGSVNRLTAHVDLYPTLCELCELPPPAHADGFSLLPLLSGSSVPVREAVYSHRRPLRFDRLKVYSAAHSTRTERYRYTEYQNQAGQVLATELFDYSLDPQETRNHSDDPQYRETRERMRVLLDHRTEQETA